jgi:hypothetical protein
VPPPLSLSRPQLVNTDQLLHSALVQSQFLNGTYGAPQGNEQDIQIYRRHGSTAFLHWIQDAALVAVLNNCIQILDTQQNVECACKNATFPIFDKTTSNFLENLVTENVLYLGDGYSVCINSKSLQKILSVLMKAVSDREVRWKFEAISQAVGAVALVCAFIKFIVGRLPNGRMRIYEEPAIDVTAQANTIVVNIDNGASHGNWIIRRNQLLIMLGVLPRRSNRVAAVAVPGGSKQKPQNYIKTTEKYVSRCVYLSKRKAKYLKVNGQFVAYKTAVKILNKKY